MNTHDIELSTKGQEILGLVDTLIASVNEAHHARSEGWRDGCFQAADETYKKIKTELAAIEADRKRRGEPVPPEDEGVSSDWISASDVDGVVYDGPSFERGYQYGVIAELDRLTGTTPEWPDFARMEASLQRLKERLVFENARRNDLERKFREQRHER